MAGTPQNATVNTVFATAFQAIVEDQYGNPVSGVSVTFSAPGSGASGSFAGSGTTTVSTNALGRGQRSGLHRQHGRGQLHGAGDGRRFIDVVQPEQLIGTPASVTTTAGSPQITTVNTAFGTALQATVDDQYGNPISGVSVTFTAPKTGSSGNFAGSGTTTATTNSAGVATAPIFTANTVVGQLHRDGDGGRRVGRRTFYCNTPGPASSITATAGTPQSAAVGTAFATAFRRRSTINTATRSAA